jgi:hypothetical protein
MPTTLTLPDEALTLFAKETAYNPLKYVLAAFPWEEDGTLLALHQGPDTWQTRLLEMMGTTLSDPSASPRFAVASGHGVGKTAMAAWLILWFLATRPHPQIVVTANTSTQLATKTWRELSKWLQLSIFHDTFTWTATRCYHRQAQPTWFAAAVPWRADRPEAFAGTHEEHVLLLMDEASAIDDLIWETSEGMMTTPGSLWVAFGNPTRATGRFRECFPGGRFAHRWQHLRVDSRDAKMADSRLIESWITDYGMDSDFVRVRVLGEFPRQAVGQFISEADLEEAEGRAPTVDALQPTTIGVDVARFGDDRSVVLVRQGSQIAEMQVYREIDTVRLAGYVCEIADRHRTQGSSAGYGMATYQADEPVLCIDGVGLGAGVVDICRTRGYRVEDVLAGGKPQDTSRYENIRSESWDRMRQWVRTRASFEKRSPWYQELRADLLSIEYGFDDKGRLQLERKQHMKDRGMLSPDCADALALTLAVSIAPRRTLPHHSVGAFGTLQGLPPGLAWMAT